MNVLSLFSGIGGLELGLERAGITVVGQVEIDDYCRRVLAKHWPEVPRHDDVRTCVDWWRAESRPAIDLICGGFPCQDISNAGRRAGIVEGTRSSLWAHMADCVRALRPRYVLVENVSALLARGLDVVLADLAACGYDAEWDCIPASAVGANHERDRVWVVAYPVSESRRPCGPGDANQGPRGRDVGRGSVGTDVADTDRLAGAAPVSRHVFTDSSPRLGLAGIDRRCWASRRQWRTEPDVGRVAHGIPHRVDRLRALGNAVVPQVAEHVGRLILDHNEEAAA